MPRMIKVASSPGQIAERRPSGKVCHHRCRSRASALKPSLWWFDRVKLGEMWFIDWLPIWPAVCGQRRANVQVTPAEFCALDNIATGPCQLLQPTTGATGKGPV